MDPGDPNGPFAVNVNWVPAAPAAVAVPVAAPPGPNNLQEIGTWRRRGRLMRGASGAWGNKRDGRLERL